MADEAAEHPGGHTATELGQRPVGADVRVVDEAHAVGCELARELIEIAAQHVRLSVHERVEAEDEVDRAVLDHVERAPIVHLVLDVVASGEALTAQSIFNQCLAITIGATRRPR